MDGPQMLDGDVAVGPHQDKVGADTGTGPVDTKHTAVPVVNHGFVARGADGPQSRLMN